MANEFGSIMMIDGRFARSNLLKYDNSNVYRRPAKDEAFVISSILIRSIGAEIGKSKLEQRIAESGRVRSYAREVVASLGNRYRGFRSSKSVQ